MRPCLRLTASIRQPYPVEKIVQQLKKTQVCNGYLQGIITPMIQAQEALARLKEGNHRFASGKSDYNPNLHASQRSLLVDGQTPFAVVLGCSDSRVPVEMIFDQGFGDLFVIRVAGNVVASSQIGSIEFAADLFNVRLVVVMGHTGCGAIAATIDALKSESNEDIGSIRSIVDRIRPAIEGLLETDLAHDPEALKKQAVRANARMSVNSLRHGSNILENLIEKQGLLIVGAEYCLETGVVDFFEAPLGTDNASVLAPDRQGSVPGDSFLVRLGGKISQLWAAFTRMLKIHK